ncbi:CPBP family intramembrane glutamic endopeptidase [Gracilibacillus xinjiangensis]|uniref:CPBP family intramembrane glutamic endopeptidase n=1 Tax=Gracilibacillus xinjiangensis TaxID=1193282 RepID=A0ABV8WU13_9BACI
MKRADYNPSAIFRNLTALFFFAALLVILQVNDTRLLIMWGICLLFLVMNRSMRLFLLTTLVFGIGFYVYGYMGSNWHITADSKELLKILNRLSLIFIIIPFLILSFIYKTPAISYWQKPDWNKMIPIPFIWAGFHQTKAGIFLFVAMMTNLMVFTPFMIKSGWTYIQGIFLFMIIFSILNAVLEEIIWRGILLSRFSEDFGSKWAVILTSVGFGLQHYSLGFSWVSCVFFIFGGFFFGAITVTTKSIIPAIIWHMFINALMVLSGMII